MVLLRDLAPGLGPIVASSAVRARLDAYERADQEAKRQQGLLFHEATAANLCLLGAGVLSSLVLAGPGLAGLLGETWTDRAALWIGLATLALGALAAMYGYRARESDRLRRWFTMRGTAEVARLETFRAIAPPPPRPARPPPPPGSPCSAAICSTISGNGWSPAPPVIASPPMSPTAGAGSPRRSPSSAAVPP